MFLLLEIIPFMMSCAAALTGSIWLGGGAMVAILVSTAWIPAARHKESMFVFAMTAVDLIPMNLRLLKAVAVLTDGMPAVIGILWTVLLYCILSNMEQLVLGYAARRIWPKQKRSLFTEKTERK